MCATQQQRRGQARPGRRAMQAWCLPPPGPLRMPGAPLAACLQRPPGRLPTPGTRASCRRPYHRLWTARVRPGAACSGAAPSALTSSPRLSPQPGQLADCDWGKATAQLPRTSGRPTATSEPGQPSRQVSAAAAGPTAAELEQIRLQYEELQTKHWNALQELHTLQRNALRCGARLHAAVGAYTSHLLPAAQSVDVHPNFLAPELHQWPASSSQ